MAGGEASAGSWVLPVVALSLATFAVGTAELIVAGLLPAVAREFAIDIPTAGILISGYALGVAIGGPLLSLPTSGMPRRTLLFLVMAVFIAGNVLCALAGTYWMLLGGRLVTSASHGLFFGIAMVIATRLAPPDRSATAVSVIVAGFTAASLIGLPVGAAIGNLYSWRAVFWLIALLGLLSSGALAAMIPAAANTRGEKADLGAELAAVRRPAVLICYLLIAMFITADLAVYAYIVPILTDVTGVAIELVPWLLFVAGIAGIIGNLAGGRLGDWNATATVIGIFALLVGMYIALPLAMPYPVPMVAVCVVWWLVGFAFPAPIQARILKEASNAPNLASTLISTAFNLGIAGGAALGGLALDRGWGYISLPWISLVFAAGGLAIALWLAVRDRRVVPAPAA
jgi:DHA1 family inner membrane transport protein